MAEPPNPAIDTGAVAPAGSSSMTNPACMANWDPLKNWVCAPPMTAPGEVEAAAK